MSEVLVTKILDKYGISVSQIYPPQKGYRNLSYKALTSGGEFINLILYKHENNILEKIKAANFTGEYLAGNNLPVRKPLSEKIIKITFSGHVQYAAIYNYLPGETIPWEGYTMKHIKLLGQNLASVHASLKLMPLVGHLKNIVDISEKLNQEIYEYFKMSGVNKAVSTKLGLQLNSRKLSRYTKLFSFLGESDQMQALHMDFVRGNILFEDYKGLKISGIIDFEKSAYGPPVFDVARTLAFLLVDCKFKQEANVRKYFLRSGYYKVNLESVHSNTVLEELINFYLTHDFYKFLQHNPYEHLPKNEHFIRTKNFMISRGLLNNVRMETIEN